MPQKTSSKLKNKNLLIVESVAFDDVAQNN